MPGRRARVLLLEPDSAAGRLLVTALETAGFEVERLAEPRAALAAMQSDRPDGIVVALDGPALEALLRRIADLESRGPARTGLIARSATMARVVEQVERLAPARTALLLEGEPGTGKHRIARAVHALGPRRNARFVAVDCAAKGPPALEAVLFGAPGAEAGPPALERAEGGTLYLERVGAAPPAVQVRLLRLLQERTWEREDGTATAADVRLLASSEGDLASEAAAGRFRGDLFDRLSVTRLDVPPLRRRREDLPLLVREILRGPRRKGRRTRGISAGALDRLLAHEWPGNVRELETTITGMAALAGPSRPLGLEDLPAHLRPAAQEAATLVAGMTVAEAERALIEATMRHAGGDKARAAALLGIGLRTLYRRLGETPAGRPRSRAKAGSPRRR